MKTSRRLLRELMGHAANAGSLDAVYEAALQGVQVQLGAERASLLLFDAAGIARFVAWAGLSDEYRKAVDGHSPWSPDELDARPVLVGDVSREPSLAPFAAVLAREQIRALAFVPLQFGARLHGKFMLYYREPHAFSVEEIETAEQIADYVVMSIEHHRLAVALKEQLATERDLRRHAEESESRLHVALVAGQMGTWEWDIVKSRAIWSKELERMHGLEPGTFDGSVDTLLKLVHPLDAERVSELLRNCTPSRDADHELEFRMVRTDGAVRWLASRGRLIVDESGAPSRIVGVCTDITELKRMAETAKEADRRKDEFLATLAHELRNPLAAVRAGVAVIRKAHADGAAVVEHCSIVERQLRQLTRMVDDLLDVADITRRGLPLEKSRVEIGTIVRMALEQARPLIEEAGHTLSVRLPAEQILLDADPARLVQVLTNLLNNAVKYSPAGGQIEISVRREGGELGIFVKDSGIGIPAEKLESVFEMFGQLDRSLESGYKGLGIGLALARTLVGKHDGRIKAHSDGPGRGSEFSVWLPLAQQPESMRTLVQPTVHPIVSAGCRVLMVDDNEDVATAMSRLMRILGHDVRVALNGAQALELVDSFRPDVVLLDIAMPKMNGYEVARLLRSHPLGRAMVLVAVTGWGREHDQRRSAEAGFDRHMTKPVDPLALEVFLDSVARRQSAAEDFVWQSARDASATSSSSGFPTS